MANAEHQINLISQICSARILMSYHPEHIKVHYNIEKLNSHKQINEKMTAPPVTEVHHPN